MAEEVRNAEMNVPRSMIISVIVNGMLSFGVLLMLLFYAGSVEGATRNAPNGYPFIAIFAQGIGSNAGATGLTSIVALLELCSATASLAAASRMMWSFARDRGLPAHKHLSKVCGGTKLSPMYFIDTKFHLLGRPPNHDSYTLRVCSLCHRRIDRLDQCWQLHST